MIPTGLVQHASKLKFLMNENSTTILTGVGVVGTIATAYLSGRASFKSAAIIEQERSKGKLEHSVKVIEEGTPDSEISVFKKPELTTKEKIQVVWPQYIPPAVVGAVTIASIIMAHRISSKKIAALVVASGVSERAFQEYKAKVIEKLGERQDEKIRDEVAQDRVTNNPPQSSEVIISGDGNVLCYDTLTGRYFRSTVENIKRAENACNHDINQQLGVSLSRFYEELNLPPTTYTDSVGWFQNNPLEVQFTTTLAPDNQPCIAVAFSRMPSPDYDSAWT